MSDANVPSKRSLIRSDLAKTSQPVGQTEWSAMAKVANWINGDPRVSVCSHHVGITATSGGVIILDTTFTTTPQHRNSTASVSIYISAFATVDAPATPTLDITGTVGGVALFGGLFPRIIIKPHNGREEQGDEHCSWEGVGHVQVQGGPVDVVLTATCATNDIVIQSITISEVPRSYLRLDNVEYGADDSTCTAGSPIADLELENASVRGVWDAYLNADARRSTYFYRQGTAAITITDTSFQALYPLGIPLQGQVVSVGDTTDTGIIVEIQAYATDYTGKIQVSSTSAADSQTETIAIAGAYTTYTFQISFDAEDLTSTDGLQSSVWEELNIEALTSTAGGQVIIGSIAVFKIRTPL